MTTPDPVTPSDDGGFLAPKPGSSPSDHCYRCGRPTPAGQSLCTTCNPGKVKGPSPTQLHATILGGVILGGIALLFLWRFMVGQGGPYVATITQRSMTDAGSPTISVTVVNTGETAGVANCRVTRDGAARPDDPTYRTERIEPGANATLDRTIPAPPVNTPAYDTERMTVLCT